MTTRKRALTAQIKPETRNAIMDQLAAAADEIIRLRRIALDGEDDADARRWGAEYDAMVAAELARLPQPRRFWQRFVPTWWQQ